VQHKQAHQRPIEKLMDKPRPSGGPSIAEPNLPQSANPVPMYITTSGNNNQPLSRASFRSNSAGFCVAWKGNRGQGSVARARVRG